MHLKMVESESMFAYLDATREYIERHGKPVALYSNKRTVFRNPRASAWAMAADHLCPVAAQRQSRIEDPGHDLHRSGHRHPVCRPDQPVCRQLACGQVHAADLSRMDLPWRFLECIMPKFRAIEFTQRR